MDDGSARGCSVAVKALQKVEERLSCAVCLDTFTQPRFLPCHHAFCQTCLGRLPRYGGPPGSESLKCPACRKPAQLPEEGIYGFPNAFDVSDLEEVREMLRKLTDVRHVSCENCEERASEGFCQQCQHFLCQKCIDAHSQLVKLFSGHQIVSASDAMATDPKPRPVRHASLECTKHDMNLSIYCHTCDRLVCQDCTIRDHARHDYDPISDRTVFAKYRREIESHLRENKEQLAFVTQAMEMYNKRTAEIEENRDQIKEEIRATGEQMISEYTSEIRQSMSQLEQKVDAGAKKKLGFMSALVAEVQTMAAMLQSCVKYVEGKLKIGSRQQILASKRHMVDTMKLVASQVREDKYSVMEKPNIRMWRNTENGTAIGKVEFQTLVDKCKVAGEGIEETCAGQRTRFSLAIVPSPDSDPLSLPTSLISCQLSSPRSTCTTDCSIAETSPGKYEVSYTPVSTGPHQLRVRVGSTEIPSSPFTVEVKATASPLRTIGELNGPCSISIGSSGIVAVTEYHGHCVTLLDREGMTGRSFGSGGTSIKEFNYPGGVAVTHDSIIVSDGLNHRIQKFDKEGRFQETVGSYGDGQLCFRYPDGINVDRSDRIYVVDCENHRIQVLNSDLSFSHTFGVKGSQPGQFRGPCSVGIDSEGMLYVTDNGNHRVQKFTPEGDFVLQFGQKGRGAEDLSSPIGITVDTTTDTVYISSDHRISVFTANGQFLREFGRQGSGDGEFNTPMGLAVDESTGNLYVCDFGNGRLVVY